MVVGILINPLPILVENMGKECYNIHGYKCIYYKKWEIMMINYNKLLKKLKEKGITTYAIRQKALIPQSTLRKFNMCSGDSMEEIEKKLEQYKQDHNGKEFMCDVSTKTIEDICQLLQCQPQDLIEWEVDLKPELSYESRYKKSE